MIITIDKQLMNITYDKQHILHNISTLTYMNNIG